MAIKVFEAIAAFERDYWQRRKRSPKSETTWEIHYLSVFKKLPSDQFLTPELLIESTTAITPDTCQRKRFCHVLGCLAEFCGVSVDLKRYAGTYNHLKAAPRKLPTDCQIIEVWKSITSPQWQYSFGLLAAYGLRPHELFLFNSDQLESQMKLRLDRG